MSGFKDMIASDINSVFLNVDEFGEEHEIDGNTIVCIIDENGLSDRQGGAVFAVGQSTINLYAKSEELPNRKGYGSELMIDGVPYMINTWDEHMGMSSINLFITVNS